jgi:hypothetical protein
MLVLIIITLCLQVTSVHSKIYSFPLLYDDTYSYRTNLTLGSKQQSVSVILDTGSPQLIISCESCVFNCPKTNYFQNTQSTTYGTTNCALLTSRSNPGFYSNLANLCAFNCFKNKAPGGQGCFYSSNMGSGNLTVNVIYQLVYD